MANLVQLVFYGEILPGYDAATVKEKLTGLLKLQPSQINAVFSGQRIVLRKGMSKEEAELYLLHMQHIGVRALIEEIPVPTPTPTLPVANTAPNPEPEPAPAPFVQPPAATLLAKMLAAEQAEAAPSAKPPSSQSAPAPAKPLFDPGLVDEHSFIEEMSCPKCGERQPPRTLCRACSVDMKRFVAAQKEIEDAARAERIAAREDMLNSRRGATVPRAARNERSASDGQASFLGLGLSGRLGRAAYLAGIFLSAIISCLSILLAIKTNGLFVFYVLSLLGFYYSLRLIALRCHDRGWSGWLCFLILIPLVNIIFGLMLLFMPGTTDNEYGEQPQSAGALAPIVLFLLFVASFRPLMQTETQMQMAQLMMGSMGKAAQAAMVEKRSKMGEVTIYVKSDCEPCKQLMMAMDMQGVPYIKKDIESSEAHRREFEATGAKDVPHIALGAGNR